MMDLNRPIYTLTVGEFIDLQKSIQAGNTGTLPEQSQQLMSPPRRLVYGLRGLAELLGVSKVTACRIKASGRIDEAISQEGRNIIVDADKTLEILKKNNNEKNH